MKLNFTWKRKTGQYQNGDDLYLNRIYLGEVSWNDSLSKNMPEDDKIKKQYSGSTHLYSNKTYYGSTAEDVKTQIEKAILVWFNEALKEG